MKIKELTYKITKIIWFILGGIISLWTVWWFFKMYSVQGLGGIGTAVMFAMGIYALLIYIGIMLIFLLIKWVVKKLKN